MSKLPDCIEQRIAAEYVKRTDSQSAVGSGKIPSVANRIGTRKWIEDARAVTSKPGKNFIPAKSKIVYGAGA